MSTELQIGGFEPFTMIDFPWRTSCVVFLQGCEWRCRYCQNPHLLLQKNGNITWSIIVEFLKKRQNLLDAVVFSGGEPTLQHTALLEVFSQIHELGFEIGLHTSGYNSSYLENLLPFVQWVGLDIKALPTNYQNITCSSQDGTESWKSAELLISYGIKHEIRITVHPYLTTSDELDEIICSLNKIGITNIAVQQCRTTTIRDHLLKKLPKDSYIEDYEEMLEKKHKVIYRRI